MIDACSEGTSSTSARRTTGNVTSGGRRSDGHFVIAKCRRPANQLGANVNSSTNQETTDDSDKEERIMVAYCRSGKLGAAYFTLQTGELFILDEIVDRPPDYLMFCNLFRQVSPVLVLLDGSTQGTFVSKVKSTVFATSGGQRAGEEARQGEGEGKCKLMLLSSKEYNFEACKRRIYTLSLPHEPSNCSDEERTMFLRTVVDFSQTQSVHALGALLRYLDLNWSNMIMDLHGKPEFMSLRKISLADIVTIDEESYRGLQIFSSISHPSNFKKGVHGSNKEGLSLFYLFSKCSSKVGHSRMRVLMQHPSTNIELLKRRQDVVAFFMRSQNDSIMRNICASLRFIKNVNGILAKIKALSAKAYQWKSLYNTLYNAVLICEICENIRGSAEILEQLASCDNNKLYEMALYMNRIIDFDLTKSEGKFTVKAGVDQDLDMKKQTMASLYGLMSETAKVELERLPSFVEECTMLYMPHLGYLLGVKAWADNLTMEQKELPNMKFMFQNNDYIHYKSKGCEELDMVIGDTYPEIVAHETRIMMRLTTIILENLHSLANVIEMCAELDCLIVISKVSKELNFVRPVLTTDKMIDIKQGKHPLYALNCDNFVPNDTRSSQDSGLVKILTAPNSSGKSVYMKQIGLIVYLAHIGSFVPAESATIGIVRHIYTRIQTTECVAAHMSAFLIDLRQMALALNESTSNSLVLIDEFGKGTNNTSGLALLAACLHIFLCREEDCPHLVVATHFLSIKDFTIQTPLVRFLTFEHIIEDGMPVFLFRVTDGAVDSSFACQVARSSGIDTQLVQRAVQVGKSIEKNPLPPPNKKIMEKLKTFTESVKRDLLSIDSE